MTLDATFDRPALDLAPDLLGATLLIDGIGGIIVETEAYHPEDPASHSFRGPTPRNQAMFNGPGRLYVYRSYGIHWCLNIVAAGASAVLIRAIEPTQGLEIMAERRGITSARGFCSGPGKLCQALGVTAALDNHLLSRPPLRLIPRDSEAFSIVVGPRIGITKAVDLPWRFGLSGSKYLSKPFPR